jgi:tetratricopeptide (TPR) repeat protein
MATDPAALAQAWAALQAGDPGRAAQFYRDVLRADPDNADVWCLLGIACRAGGRPEEAAAAYREALRLRPEFVEAWNNLGNALLNLSRPDEAADAFHQALRLRPGYAEAHNNLAAVLRQQGRWAEATAHYREALRLKPEYADAHNNLGVALQGTGRLEEAEACYREALRLRPAYPEALANLGSALNRLGRLDEAERCCREALRLRPGYLEGHNNLGTVRTARRDYAAAEACYREALRLKPDYAEGHHNLGTALAEQGQIDEAVACYREALRLRPDYPEACGNLATALLARGQPDEAVAAFDDILRRKPGSPDAHLGRAIALLVKGDWAQGWKEYEWRWRCEEFGGQPYAQPQWDGTLLAGRTILLHAEQGVGDTLLFVRYARLVKERGGTVVFCCPPALRGLLAGCPSIDRLTVPGEPAPAFDCYAPLLSLPAIFGTTPQNAPAEVPYLFPEQGLVEHWRRELGPAPRFRVGIVWQGNPRYKADRLRSVPLAQFEPLARVPGVELVSLQKGPGAEQLAEVASRFPVTDLASRLDLKGPFVDTAAAIKALDLVVSVDTAVAHLAGALGVPVWVALHYSPHWVWMLGRDDSPWYPSARLFRQRQWGDWGEVFARMAGELGRLAARPRSAPLLVELSPGELFDRIAALAVEAERLADADRRGRARVELARLEAVRGGLPRSVDLAALAAELRAAHAALWEARDGLRQCERAGDFGPRFVALARAACRHEDRRAEAHEQINGLLRRDQ